VVRLDLPIGNYQILLNPGWSLERSDDAGYTSVVAALASTNPVAFVIQERQTTKVAYRFVVNGEVVTPPGQGTVEVSIEVVEADAGAPDTGMPDTVVLDTCPPDLGLPSPIFEQGVVMLVGQQAPYGASYLASGDLDGDGWPDIAMSHDYRTGGVVLNQHNKKFAPDVLNSETWWNAQNRQGATSVTLADLDADGKLDYVFALYGADYSGKAIQLFKGDGKGNHALPPGLTNGLVYTLRGTNPLATRVADFDHNGLMDIAAGSNNGGHTVDILLQKTAWVFTPTFAYNHDRRSNPQWIEMGDLNNDGWMDLVVPFLYGLVEVYLNKADGTGALTWSGSYVSANHHQVAVADFNQDGFADIVARSHLENHVDVLYNDRTGRFPTTSSYSVSGRSGQVGAGDLDCDGDMDLVVCSTSTSSMDVLLNDGAGVFRAAETIPLDEPPNVMGLNDFDNDGDLDVAVYTTASGVGDHLRVLWNRRIP
jgi:hypothetical protein